jgi:hypothetical protein
MIGDAEAFCCGFACGFDAAAFFGAGAAFFFTTFDFTSFDFTGFDVATFDVERAAEGLALAGLALGMVSVKGRVGVPAALQHASSSPSKRLDRSKSLYDFWTIRASESYLMMPRPMIPTKIK